MSTVIPVGDPKAIRKYSALLAAETLKHAYFKKRFTGKGQNNIIEEKMDLVSDAGDTIQFDLSVQLRQKPVIGDKKLKGKEEDLRFYTDEVKIDQARIAISLGGRMTNKRTLHNLREVARARGGEYWAAYMDQMTFMYLSGARGVNEDFYEDTNYTGFAGNSFDAPDAGHIMYGGAATSKASLVAGDTFDRDLVEKASVKANMMRAKNPDSANMVPVTVNGGKHYVVVMSDYQAHNLRTDSGTTNWLEIQKAAAAAEGRKSPIFNGGLGMINDVVLHKHQNAIRFDDYGAGSNVEAARSLFMGRQAGVCAYGTPKGMRFRWIEEKTDFDNAVDISAGVIFGMKKSRFNGKDFGVMALDTAAKDPT